MKGCIDWYENQPPPAVIIAGAVFPGTAAEAAEMTLMWERLKKAKCGKELACRSLLIQIAAAKEGGLAMEAYTKQLEWLYAHFCTL